MRKEEYPYPDGEILTESLCLAFNNVVGHLDGRFPLAGLYIDPRRAYMLSRRYPVDLSELYAKLTDMEKRVTRAVYSKFINFLINQARALEGIGGLVEKEEFNPNLEYARRFTLVGLSQVTTVGRNGRLFIYHSVKPFGNH